MMLKLDHVWIDTELILFSDNTAHGKISLRGNRHE